METIDYFILRDCLFRVFMRLYLVSVASTNQGLMDLALLLQIYFFTQEK